MFDQLKTFNYRSLLTTRQSLSMAVVAVVISLGLIFFGILPQIQALISLQSEFSKEDAKVKSLEKKSAELQQLPSSTLFSQEERLNQTLPSQKPLLPLLNSLQKVGGDAGVIFSGIDISPGSISTQSAQGSASNRNRPSASSNNRGVYSEMYLELNVEGTLSQINQFLSLVEKVAPLSSLTSIELQKEVRDDDDAAYFKAKLMITTYYFTQSISATIDAPLPAVGSKEEAVLTEINTFIIPQIVPQTQIVGGGDEDLFKLNEEE